MKTKAIQKFTPEYLDHCKQMKPDQIAQFLEDFRLMHGEAKPKDPSKLISMKIPHSLLTTFKTRCQLLGTPYQSQIKKLMEVWLREYP